MPCGVPNLEFAFFAVDVDDGCAEFYTDGVGDVLLEAGFSEALHEAGFAAAHRSDDDLFDDVFVRHFFD